MRLYIFAIIGTCLVSISSTERLKVCSGNSRKFCYDGQEVYLSGMNQAWSSYHHYAKDFGNYYYNNFTKSDLTYYLQQIRLNGGNSIRIFLHTDSQLTPCFSSDGSVSAADCSGNHIIEEMKEYLCIARRYQIIVFFVLWNGALFNNHTAYTNAGPQFNGLITVDYKLQSYINNALIPIVTALKNYPSLGGYDIINEPEGIVITDHAGPGPICHNAIRLNGTGAGFGSEAPNLFWMHRLQKFVNWQANAIKQHDPRSLVTVGSWSEKTQYNPWSTIPYSVEPTTFNYFSDACLVQAGLRPNGVLDFYQMHTYSHGTSPYNTNSPMNRPASFYNLNKPLVIGEFSSVASLTSNFPWPPTPRSIQSLVSHAYNGGYAGAWSWHAAGIGHNTDSLATQAAGLQHIRCNPGVWFLLKTTDAYECPPVVIGEAPASLQTVRCVAPTTTSTTPGLATVGGSFNLQPRPRRTTTRPPIVRPARPRAPNIGSLLNSGRGR